MKRENSQEGHAGYVVAAAEGDVLEPSHVIGDGRHGLEADGGGVAQIELLHPRADGGEMDDIWADRKIATPHTIRGKNKISHPENNSSLAVRPA